MSQHSAAGIVVWHGIGVDMRDGVRLATDIYFPPSVAVAPEQPVAGRAPALLLRTPYDRQAPERRALAAQLARDGYVAVVQDCRGRFDSEGQFVFLQREAEDGYDTVEWIARQPWSDGQVGAFGTSYSASAVSALATLNPPHLKAMWIHEGVANGLKESVRQGGAFELRWLAWALYGAMSDPTLSEAVQSTLLRSDLRNWLRPLRTFEEGVTPLALAPSYQAWLWDLYSRAEEGALWENRGLNIERYWDEHADVPTVYSGGWYDSYTRATIRNFVGLRARKKSPQILLVGPWVHGWREVSQSFAGMVDFGESARLDFYPLLKRWFDFWLKGEGDLPWRQPVQYFVMGGGSGRLTQEGRLDHGGEWSAAASWPPCARALTWFLWPDGALREHPCGEPAKAMTWTYDPAHPVPSIGGNISFLTYMPPEWAEMRTVPVFDRLRPLVPAGGFDQTTHPGVFGAAPPYGPLRQRADVLSFATDPLLHPVVAAGPVTVRLYVQSDAPDTDFTAKLIDWYPPSDKFPEGFALNLGDSIQRLRFRNGYAREEEYEPGSIVEVTIELYPIANRFEAGHRIRVDISSSNFPRFDVNPNTGEPIGRARSHRVAHNSVVVGGPYRPCLMLYGEILAG